MGHKPFLLLLIGVFHLLFAVHSVTAQLSLDPNFSPDYNTDPNQVIAIQPDDKILVGGSGHLIRLFPNGDTDFHIVLDGYVANISIQDDEKILICGIITAANGVLKNHIARLNVDGSFDPSFDANANGSILCMALQQDGKILIGGTFTSVNGISCGGITRLNGDGSIDSSFVASVEHTYGHQVSSILIDPYGDIIISGIFDAVNGIYRDRMARLDPDGNLMSGYSAGGGRLQFHYRTSRVYSCLNGTSAAQRSSSGIITDSGWGANGTFYLNGAYSQLQLEEGIYSMSNFAFVEGSVYPVVGVNSKHIDLHFPSGTTQSYSPDSFSINQQYIVIQRDGNILSTASGHPVVRVLTGGDPAQRSISAIGSTEIHWSRGGGSPEASRVIFELSTDEGLTWTLLGEGTRGSGDSYVWELTGLSLPQNGLIRGRAAILHGKSRSLMQEIVNLSPEITIRGNGIEIVDGASVPSPENNTDFGIQTVSAVNGYISKNFTIHNSGGRDLVVTGISSSGDHAADFTVAGISLPLTVHANASQSFTVTYNPSGLGLRTAVLTVENDDPNEGSYEFNIQGTGVEPEINVKGNGVDIADTDSSPSLLDHTDFGTPASPTGLVSRTFMIESVGISPLTINAVNTSGLDAQYFQVSGISLPMTLAPGDSTSFTVTFAAIKSGLNTTALFVSSNDGDEGSYAFSLQASAMPEINIKGNGVDVANNDSSPSLLDHTDFGAPFTSSMSRTFTIESAGETPLIINAVNTSGLDASSFQVSGISLPMTLIPGDSTSFTVTFTASNVGVSATTLFVSSNDGDEGSYAFSLQATVMPEINIKGNGVGIANNDTSPSLLDHTDFGTPVSPGSTASRTFMIESAGETPLIITAVNTSGLDASSFQVSGISLPMTLVPGDSTSFTVTFTAIKAGLSEATLLVSSNDGDEGSYAFSIQATTMPEINVRGNGVDIAAGDSTPSSLDGTDYTSILMGAAGQEQTFNIQNLGTGPLTVASIALSGPNASDFTISSPILPFEVAAGSSQNITVTLGISPPGLRSAVVNLTCDDANEGNYSFSIQGPGIEAWQLPAQSYAFTTAAEIPVTTSTQVDLTGKSVILGLNYAPAVGTNLTVIRNTGLMPFIGEFTNLAQGQEISLSYEGKSYFFVANYFGGRVGNDLVLHWAGSQPFAWGNNASGRLGIGTTVELDNPEKVTSAQLLAGKTVFAVASGGEHTLALLSDGTVLAWGQNSSGQLGTNNTVDSHFPVEVNTLSASGSHLAGKKVVAIAAGYKHSLALCSDGTLVGWGFNTQGQTGNGTSTLCYVPKSVQRNAAHLTTNMRVVSIASGPCAYHSMALCSDGTLVAWGRNDVKCLGDQTTTDRNYPVLVKDPVGSHLIGRQVIGMAAGLNFSMALCSDGTVASWGDNASGRLGNGSTVDKDMPTPVTLTSSVTDGHPITDIAAGEAHALAVRSDGRVIAWGYNYFGQVGIGSTTVQHTPVLLAHGSSTLIGKTVVSVAAGEAHSYALCSDGTLHAWGQNNFGQLGLNSSLAPNYPDDVSTVGLATGSKFVYLSSGFDHGHALVAELQAIAQVEHPLNTQIATGATMDFGSVYYATGVTGQMAPQRVKTFYIRNVGAGTLTNITVSKTGSALADYTLTSSPPASLASGGLASFMVEFNPTALGTRTAKLEIKADSIGGQRTFEINMTGVSTNTVLNANFTAPSDIPLTVSSLTATGTVNVTLGFIPTVANGKLTLVNNTGSGYINGSFSNLPPDQVITLSYNAQSYEFLVNYYGGTGNDLVLEYIGYASAGDHDSDGFNNLEEFRYATLLTDGRSFMVPVNWTSHVNSSAGPNDNGGLFQSGAGTSWAADAIATAKITGNGMVSFSAAAGSKAAVGFSVVNSTRDFAGMSHAIVCGNTTANTAAVYEMGVLKADLGPYLPTTIFSIKRTGTQVVYFKNRTSVYTSSSASQGAVLIDSSLASPTSGLTSVYVLSDDRDGDGMLDLWEFDHAGSPPSMTVLSQFDPSANPDNDDLNNLREFLMGTVPNSAWSFVRPVQWEQHRFTETQAGDAGGLKKISYATGASSAEWDADAVSHQRIVSVGKVAFRLSANAEMAVGLTLSNPDAGLNSLTYSIVTSASNTAAVYLGGTLDTNLGSYDENTWFWIRRSGSYIEVYKDQVLRFQSPVSPGSLVVDTSFRTLNATVLEAWIECEDQDTDLMPDSWETQYASGTGWAALLAFLHDADPDNDDLNNLQEYQAGTNPLNPDHDGDGLPDGWEVSHGLNPKSASDAMLDLDQDGLTNQQEYVAGTQSDNPDTDGDGLPDGWEVQYSLNPLSADENSNSVNDRDDHFDADLLTNYVEFQLGTNPLLTDTDGNGIHDHLEYYTGIPNGTDTDGDGVSDDDETAAGTDPADWASSPYVQLLVTTPIR